MRRMCADRVLSSGRLRDEVLLVGTLFLLVLPGSTCSKSNNPGTPDSTNPFSGQAVVGLATINGTSYTVSDTGLLPEEGGALETSALSLQIGTVLTAEVAHASAIGQGLSTHSEASLANLNVTAGGHQVTLDFVSSHALAECTTNGPSASGDFQIAALVVDGHPHSLTTDANQTFVIFDLSSTAVGRITANEQVLSITEEGATITVNGLHVEIFGVADIVLAHSNAGITCVSEQPAPVNDFITGGGRISTSGSFANFGVAGGLQNDELWGHLTYIDHGTNLKAKGTGVTAYSVVDDSTRHIEGTAEINGAGGFTYQVDVSDHGEPGTSDTFSISLSSGYSASGTLLGGNIQLHNQ